MFLKRLYRVIIDGETPTKGDRRTTGDTNNEKGIQCLKMEREKNSRGLVALAFAAVVLRL